ncbi:hypothetical protein M011DRAFT_484252 [Sporormia fimetaria CBS 119925]|uniref:BTB domain-containing protein n=1 Tax=Sporormia fimetaria CBS 119925 TaxID=1340428 RepID=A0A6A6VIL6_9PLEO|nr:hypothetical protein M011DRAFT_484252 [Sporormia fimetaria CBS 119925]
MAHQKAREKLAEAELPSVQQNENLNQPSIGYEVVTMLVGESAVAIPIHKNVLCFVSAYFRAYLDGGFAESESKTISLPDASEGIFGVFTRWAYRHFGRWSGTTRVIPPMRTKYAPPASLGPVFESFDDSSPSRSAGEPSETAGETASDAASVKSFDFANVYMCPILGEDSLTEKHFPYDDHCCICSSIYVFADKYVVDQLRDDILTAIFVLSLHWESFPTVTPELTNNAYECLPASSTFLRYLVRSTAYFGNVGRLAENDVEQLKAHHPDFLLDLLIAQSMRLENHQDNERGIPFSHREGMANSCLFHEHVERDKERCRFEIRYGGGYETALIIIQGCQKLGASDLTDAAT